MKRENNVRKLLHHDELNFPSVPNQATQWGWRWKHDWLVMANIQGRFSREFPLKGEGRKRYKELVLGLIMKG